MNKSSRTAAGSTSSRRFSQPLVAGAYDRGGRRVSDPAHLPRGVEPPPPGPGGLVSQFDDKLVAEKPVRRASRVGKEGPEGPTFDSEHYNPDGSLRTVHKMPKFADAYAEASKARYIRHKSPTDREKELSINQVFDQS